MAKGNKIECNSSSKRPRSKDPHTFKDAGESSTTAVRPKQEYRFRRRVPGNLRIGDLAERL